MPKTTKDRLNIRPVISTIDMDKEMTLEEQFQNVTLRPILKMQHDLFIAFVNSEITKKKNQYHQIRKEERESYLSQLLFRNTKNAELLRGMVLGQMALSEYQYYLQHEKPMNKRIASMLKKRIMDSQAELV